MLLHALDTQCLVDRVDSSTPLQVPAPSLNILKSLLYWLWYRLAQCSRVSDMHMNHCVTLRRTTDIRICLCICSDMHLPCSITAFAGYICLLQMQMQIAYSVYICIWATCHFVNKFNLWYFGKLANMHILKTKCGCIKCMIHIPTTCTIELESCHPAIFSCRW